MLDFLIVKHRNTNKGSIEVYPDFLVKRSKDLMIRGGNFYAIYNEETGLWSTDEYDVQYLVDKELTTYAAIIAEETTLQVHIKKMSDFSTSSWSNFKLFLTKLSDHYKQLDSAITFSNTPVSKKDYISKRLSYPLTKGDTPAFDELFGTLYDDDNLTKLMWAIGSIVAGESKRIQKFFVLFGSPGTGKSTSLNLIEKLFSDYCTSFEASALTNGTSNFSTEMFRSNPLVGLNHEGDLSRIRDNSLLNSIVAHDHIVMKVKYQHSFELRLSTMLFIATNKPVNITDSNSGMIRRLVDIRPSGKKVSADRYDHLISRLEFELGAICYKCLDIFNSLGKGYYNRYKPVDMMLQTNVIANFIEEYFFEFKKEGWISLSRAWDLYKEYCESSLITYRLQKHVFRDELKTYWLEFHPVKRIDGSQYRSVFEGFKEDSLTSEVGSETLTKPYSWTELTSEDSLLDILLANQPAQYSSKSGTPKKPWENCKTTLGSLDTSKEHYVLPPSNHIVIDFDIRDDLGNKSLSHNLEAAKRFPKTYLETSRSGSGVHLHYWYDGDISSLSRIYEPGIEVLLPVGKFSIRRKRTKNNGVEVSTINSGLPKKDNIRMTSTHEIKTERSLRLLILRNLKKEIHPNTKPSIDFIDKILGDAYISGLSYDVSDLRPYILDFASKSTNNSKGCIEIALNLKYSSEKKEESSNDDISNEGPLTFYDMESLPGDEENEALVVVCWKYEGADKSVVTLYNPTSSDIEPLLKHKLVGYNNRGYDNHLLYAIYLGYTPEQVNALSNKIINTKDRSHFFREAYDLSWVDVYDYSSKKQSLKKWQIELDLPHKELDLPWDKSVPVENWSVVGQYCANDVVTLEAVHNHLEEDYLVRLILAELSSLPPNKSDTSHISRIMFNRDKNPRSEFVHTDLSKMFKGYTYDKKKKESVYRGEVVGEGGYVYSVPGLYRDVVYMDISSMHPTSIETLNYFGKYTQRYSDIKKARIAIKNNDFDVAREMFDGLLVKYLNEDDPSKLKALSNALKLVLNRVYGLTYARFDNPFRDPRNVDNVVAKRGALFMVDLKNALLERGVDVIHIKTDSVKIANHTQEDIDFVIAFGNRYGYNFNVENVFSRLILINDADLIGKDSDKWIPVGARFSNPYVLKTLFTKEPILFKDLTEVKSVKIGAIYIDMGEEDANTEDMIFVGRIGSFCPMKKGGGSLYRVDNNKKYALSGTKGYRWLPSDMVLQNNLQKEIDDNYFRVLVDEAVDKISEFCDISELLN